MGGEIWAESNPGQGSTFHFTLQAEFVMGKHILPEFPQEAASVQDLSSLMPMNILVAEDKDNPSNQRVLVQMLKRAIGQMPWPVEKR